MRLVFGCIKLEAGMKEEKTVLPGLHYMYDQSQPLSLSKEPTFYQILLFGSHLT